LQFVCKDRITPALSKTQDHSLAFVKSTKENRVWPAVAFSLGGDGGRKAPEHQAESRLS
jgi:hypothetical protein